MTNFRNHHLTLVVRNDQLQEHFVQSVADKPKARRHNVLVLVGGCACAP